MLNQYGDRHIAAVRVAAAVIVENVVSGKQLPAGTVTGGVPESATLIDMALYSTATGAAPAGVILVFEDESFDLVVNGILVPELAASVTVEPQAPLTRAVEDVVHAAEEVTAEAPVEPAE